MIYFQDSPTDDLLQEYLNETKNLEGILDEETKKSMTNKLR